VLHALLFESDEEDADGGQGREGAENTQERGADQDAEVEEQEGVNGHAGDERAHDVAEDNPSEDEEMKVPSAFKAIIAVRVLLSHGRRLMMYAQTVGPSKVVFEEALDTVFERIHTLWQLSADDATILSEGSTLSPGTHAFDDQSRDLMKLVLQHREHTWCKYELFLDDNDEELELGRWVFQHKTYLLGLSEDGETTFLQTEAGKCVTTLTLPGSFLELGWTWAKWQIALHFNLPVHGLFLRTTPRNAQTEDL